MNEFGSAILAYKNLFVFHLVLQTYLYQYIFIPINTSNTYLFIIKGNIVKQIFKMGVHIVIITMVHIQNAKVNETPY